VEGVEVGQLLPGGGELDRPPGDRPDGQGGAAPGVAVELGQDEPGDVHALLERLGRGHRVLAGHGVDHQQHLGGLDGVADGGRLGHHLGVDGQPAGGVDDHHVAPGPLGLLAGAKGDRHRVGVGAARVGREHRDPGLLAQHLELLDGGRALQVAGDQQRLAALAGQPAGQLGRGGGLARALEAGHEQDGGRPRRPLEGHVALAQGDDQLLVDDLHHLLGRGEALGDLLPHRPLADPGDEVLHHLEVDVGLEQGQADLAQGGVDLGLGQAPVAAQAGEGVLEAVREGIEHGSRICRPPPRPPRHGR
jgi:hypothetical protein